MENKDYKELYESLIERARIVFEEANEEGEPTYLLQDIFETEDLLGRSREERVYNALLKFLEYEKHYEDNCLSKSAKISADDGIEWVKSHKSLDDANKKGYEKGFNEGYEKGLRDGRERTIARAKANAEVVKDKEDEFHLGYKAALKEIF